MVENSSISTDVWNSVTTTFSSQDDEFQTLFVANIPYLGLKIIYYVIGTVGILDNLFVVVVFAWFIRITNKVTYQLYLCVFIYKTLV